MDDVRIPLGDWVATGVDWVIDNAEAPFIVLRTIFLGLYTAINDGLTALPPWLLIGIVMIAALFARGWIFAIGSGVGLFLILAVDQWQNSMDTLALVLVAQPAQAQTTVRCTWPAQPGFYRANGRTVGVCYVYRPAGVLP